VEFGLPLDNQAILPALDVKVPLTTLTSDCCTGLANV